MFISTTQKLLQASSPKLPSKPIAASEGPRRKVLIVEDNPINQKVLVHYIKPLGWDYQIAENGLEALNCSEERVFNVILMDIEMPVMNGLEAAQQIRQREQRLGQQPVLIVGISANAQKKQIKTAKEAGMNEYMTKPVHKATLVKLIQRLSPSGLSRSETLSDPCVAPSSHLQSLAMANMTFFQAPAVVPPEVERLALQFKDIAKELAAQQYPFRALCENKCIALELPSQLLTPHLRKLILMQFKQLARKVLQEKIVKANVKGNHLRLTSHTPEETLTLKAILSEAGFSQAFNQPGGYQAETHSQISLAYSS